MHHDRLTLVGIMPVKVLAMAGFPLVGYGAAALHMRDPSLGVERIERGAIDGLASALPSAAIGRCAGARLVVRFQDRILVRVLVDEDSQGFVEVGLCARPLPAVDRVAIGVGRRELSVYNLEMSAEGGLHHVDGHGQLFADELRACERSANEFTLRLDPFPYSI